MVGFIKGITIHCYTQKVKALGLVLSVKTFSCPSNYKPMADNDTPGLGQFGPQGHSWQGL